MNENLRWQLFLCSQSCYNCWLLSYVGLCRKTPIQRRIINGDHRVVINALMVILMVIPMAIVQILRYLEVLPMALRNFEVLSGAPVETFGNVKGWECNLCVCSESLRLPWRIWLKCVKMFFSHTATGIGVRLCYFHVVEHFFTKFKHKDNLVDFSFFIEIFATLFSCLQESWL